MAAVTKKLTEDGVKSFADSFNELIQSIEANRAEAAETPVGAVRNQ